MKETEVITFRTEVRPGDLKPVEDILVSSGFFYDIEIPVALELLRDRLDREEQSTYHFVFADRGGIPVAYSCYGYIDGTLGTYDLYWIATLDDLRGQGIGRQLLEETHRRVQTMGGRMIIAETSGLEKYTPTRHFYLTMGYKAEATIADFYREGDGKVFFVKRL